MSPEILKRLTASSLDCSRQSVGGVPEITREEIAGSLAGLPAGAAHLAHAVYMQDESAHLDLVAALMVALAGDRRLEKVPDRIPGVMLGFARIGAYEALPETGVCRTCRGQGSATVRGRVIECEVCGGSGRKRISSRTQCRIFNDALEDRAREIAKKQGTDYLPRQIHHDKWDKQWRRWYEDMVPPILGAWQDRLREALNRGLRG